MTTTTTNATSGMRRCTGSTTFGIEAHEARIDDFPVQASAKDGLGRMCKPHWTEYTRALRKASVARKATEATAALITEAEPVSEVQPVVDAEAEAPAPRKGGRVRVAAEEVAGA